MSTPSHHLHTRNAGSGSRQKRILLPTLSAYLLFWSVLSLTVNAALLSSASAQAAPSPSRQKNETRTETSSDGTIINVKNADISALIRIFSEKTKRNFILDERVKGKVSLYLPKEISAEESLKILDTVLALKGFTSVPVADNLWKIVPSKEAIQSTIPTVTNNTEGSNSTSAVITRLVHLKFINADDAKQILTPLISSSGLINAYTGTNSLIIIDSEDNIDRVLELITSLDVASRGRELTIIPIEHADALDIAEKLQDILGENEASDVGTDSRSAALSSIRARLRETRSNAGKSTGGAATSTTTASTTVSARALAPKIIADERTNSVIVVADDDTTARIRGLVAQLDSETNRSGFRFYVYRCQHASSEELAEVLASLTGQGGVGGNNQSFDNNPNGLNRNSRERGGQFSRTQSRLASQSRTPGRSRSENGTGSSGPTSVNFGDDLSITSDPATNSLIIFSDKDGYEKLVELLENLDVKPRQVLVEAVLLEVQVDDNQTDAFEFQTSGGGDDGGFLAQSSFSGNLANLIADPTALSNFTIAAASSGTISVGGITLPSQTALLNAAANNSMANVLSSPNILATDNQQAEIVVGQNVPFLASTSTNPNNLNNTFNQVDRQDVGITLRITPQISSNDTVRLDIFTEVSSVLETSANSDLGPTTTVRTSETTAITKSGQMIVIGGLMSDQISEVDTGVPFLMDVPVLGFLFRSSSERTRRTNLLIFITARIIRDQFDHREVTTDERDDFREGMEQAEAYPGREELLYDRNIDRVVEASRYEGPPPSTIHAPKRRVTIGIPQKPTETTSPTQEMSSPGDKESEVSQPQFLKIEADIPLPTASKSEAQKSPALSAPSAPTTPTSRRTVLPKTVAPKTARQSTDGTKYLVLSVVSAPENGFRPPFSYGEYAAITIPPTGKRLAEELSVGSMLRYGPKDSAFLLRVESLSGTQTKAKDGADEKMAPWYQLSPFEIMNFGKGPWYREKG
ncbi:type II secretion system secretin GspD [bacterium]|nr:type II secretion system secretin GspD [bacterium]